MAAAFFKSAGIRQMMGYVEVTWYGYMGWGCLDYFVEQPGRYTFNEAFFANHHALIHRLETCFPGSNALPSLGLTSNKPSPRAKKLGVKMYADFYLIETSLPFTETLRGKLKWPRVKRTGNKSLPKKVMSFDFPSPQRLAQAVSVQ